jgi:hypothetical protein
MTMAGRYESEPWQEGRYFHRPETETAPPGTSTETPTTESSTASLQRDLYRESKVRRRPLRIRILPPSE